MEQVKGHRVWIVAEIGGNHNGDFKKAVEMVYAAKECGVDAAKFQVYVPEDLVHGSQPPLPILKGKYESQLERFRSLTFSDSEIHELKEICTRTGVEFFATPFDNRSADLLQPLVDRYKVSSGDVNNILFLQYLVSKRKPLVVSTGMAEIKEIDRIYSLIPRKHLTLLHCVSSYPTPPEEANLRAITFLSERYPDIPVGYSDHTIGIVACLGAAALGARVIEKHFTFDKTIEYGDHQLSADYSDMKQLVQQIRELESLLGEKKFERSSGELKKREFFRRGVYASKDVNKGEVITIDHIKLIRPPTQVGADEVDRVVDRRAERDISKDTPILWEHLR
jgi:sialic acid synthase SpsE